MCALFIDFSNAFDGVDSPRLMRKLIQDFRLRGHLLRSIHALLKTNLIQIDEHLRFAPPIPQTQGIDSTRRLAKSSIIHHIHNAIS